MLFSLDQSVTKNQILNNKCQESFLFSSQFEEKRGQPGLFSFRFERTTTKFISGNRRSTGGTCQGDSGGPLTIDEYKDGEYVTVQGGVLHGSLQSCSNQKYPAIFTRLTHPDIHSWLLSALFCKFLKQMYNIHQ